MVDSMIRTDLSLDALTGAATVLLKARLMLF